GGYWPGSPARNSERVPALRLSADRAGTATGPGRCTLIASTPWPPSRPHRWCSGQLYSSVMDGTTFGAHGSLLDGDGDGLVTRFRPGIPGGGPGALLGAAAAAGRPVRWRFGRPVDVVDDAADHRQQSDAVVGDHGQQR